MYMAFSPTSNCSVASIADLEPVFKDWREGRRIVELGHLADQLQECQNCAAGLHLHNCIDELRLGLGSILYVVCDKCSHENQITTGKTIKHAGESLDNALWEVNTKLGLEHFHLSTFASWFDNYNEDHPSPRPPLTDNLLTTNHTLHSYIRTTETLRVAFAFIDAQLSPMQTVRFLAALHLPTVSVTSLKAYERAVDRTIDRYTKKYCEKLRLREKRCHCYTQIDSSSPRRRNRSKNSYDRLQPGHHNKMFESVHSKFSEVPIQGKNIDVFYNKNGVERPTTIGITPKQLRSLDDTIKAIHEAIGKKHLCKVEELYDTEGNLITDVRQIENGHQYVAKDKTGIFDRGPYNPNGMKNMMVPVHSPRSQPRYLWKERSTATFGRRDERPRTLPPIQKKNSPDHSVSSYPETRKRNQVNGVPQKPAKHTKRNNRQADYDKDDGGVFKAKGQSKDTRGAREVRDTGDTKVDLPIDQVRAEEVKEEEDLIEEKEAKVPSGVELSRQPSEVSDQQDEKIRKDKQSKDTTNNKPKPVDHSHNKQPPPGDRQQQQQPGKGNQSKPPPPAAQQQANNSQKTTQNSTYKSNSKAPPPVKQETKKEEPPKKDTSNNRNNDSVRSSTPKDQKKASSPSKDNQASDEHKAATKIQANYRGHQARKEVAEKKQQKQVEETKKKTDAANVKRTAEEHQAATKIQAGFRGHQARKEIQEKKQVRDLKNSKEDAAAIKIQSGYRGHRARQEIQQKKTQRTEKNEEEEKAAVKIQAGFRGHKARQEIKDKKDNRTNRQNEEQKAATKIQAGFRGHQARKDVDKMKKDKAQHLEEEKAATKIQAGFRGHQARKEVQKKKVFCGINHVPQSNDLVNLSDLAIDKPREKYASDSLSSQESKIPTENDSIESERKSLSNVSQLSRSRSLRGGTKIDCNENEGSSIKASTEKTVSSIRTQLSNDTSDLGDKDSGIENQSLVIPTQSNSVLTRENITPISNTHERIDIQNEQKEVNEDTKCIEQPREESPFDQNLTSMDDKSNKIKSKNDQEFKHDSSQPQLSDTKNKLPALILKRSKSFSSDGKVLAKRLSFVLDSIVPFSNETIRKSLRRSKTLSRFYDLKSNHAKSTGQVFKLPTIDNLNKSDLFLEQPNTMTTFQKHEESNIQKAGLHRSSTCKSLDDNLGKQNPFSSLMIKNKTFPEMLETDFEKIFPILIARSKRHKSFPLFDDKKKDILGVGDGLRSATDSQASDRIDDDFLDANLRIRSPGDGESMVVNFDVAQGQEMFHSDSRCGRISNLGNIGSFYETESPTSESVLKTSRTGSLDESLEIFWKMKDTSLLNEIEDDDIELELIKMKHLASTYLQASVRANLSRLMLVQKMKIKSHVEEVTLLQASIRGMIFRKRLDYHGQDDDTEIETICHTDAAVKIQSAFRGYLVRKHNKIKLQDKKLLVKKQVTFGTVSRIEIVDGEILKERTVIGKEIEDEDTDLFKNKSNDTKNIKQSNNKDDNSKIKLNAAKIIKAAFIKLMENEKQIKQLDKQSNAARIIQRAMRKHLERKKEVKHKAVLFIEKRMKGFLKQKRYREIENKKKIAASIIQAKFKSWRARKVQNMRNIAATHVQCIFKGKIERMKAKESLHRQKREQAATCIQNFFKQYKLKQKEYKKSLKDEASNMVDFILKTSQGCYDWQINDEQEKEIAAKKIQVWYRNKMSKIKRSHETRQKYKKDKVIVSKPRPKAKITEVEKDAAVTRLQAAYQAHKVRLEYKKQFRELNSQNSWLLVSSLENILSARSNVSETGDVDSLTPSKTETKALDSISYCSVESGYMSDRVIATDCNPSKLGTDPSVDKNNDNEFSAVLLYADNINQDQSSFEDDTGYRFFSKPRKTRSFSRSIEKLSSITEENEPVRLKQNLNEGVNNPIYQKPLPEKSERCESKTGLVSSSAVSIVEMNSCKGSLESKNQLSILGDNNVACKQTVHNYNDKAINDIDMHKQEIAATKIQVAYRAFKSNSPHLRNKSCGDDSFNDSLHSMQVYAQTHFQASIKGFLSRQGLLNCVVNSGNCSKKNEISWYVSKLNKILHGDGSTVRDKGINSGSFPKFQAKRLDGKEDAVTVVQAVVRGFLVRRRIQRRENTKQLLKIRSVAQEEVMDILGLIHERDQAATTIQSRYRGYQDRKKYKRLQVKQQRDEAFLCLQATIRAFLARKDINRRLLMEYRKVDTPANRQGFVDSVDQVQASFHGYLFRKKFNVKLHQILIRDRAITTMQAAFKGFVERWHIRRRKLSALARYHKAASELQNGFHSLLERRSISANISRRNNSASKIQAGVRGYLARKGYQHQKRAVTRIQSGYRGYRARQQYETLVTERKTSAAKRIQANYRGYKARNEIRMQTRSVATEQLVASARGFLFRLELTKRNREIAEMQSAAAVRIQSRYRGYKNRNQYEIIKRNNTNQLRRTNAVNVIQSHFRGFLTRKQIFQEMSSKHSRKETSEFSPLLIEGNAVRFDLMTSRNIKPMRPTTGKKQAALSDVSRENTYVINNDQFMSDLDNSKFQSMAKSATAHVDSFSHLQDSFRSLLARRKKSTKPSQQLFHDRTRFIATSHLQASFRGFLARREMRIMCQYDKIPSPIGSLKHPSPPPFLNNPESVRYSGAYEEPTVEKRSSLLPPFAFNHDMTFFVENEIPVVASYHRQFTYGDGESPRKEEKIDTEGEPVQYILRNRSLMKRDDIKTEEPVQYLYRSRESSRYKTPPGSALHSSTKRRHEEPSPFPKIDRSRFENPSPPIPSRGSPVMHGHLKRFDEISPLPVIPSTDTNRRFEEPSPQNENKMSESGRLLAENPSDGHRFEEPSPDNDNFKTYRVHLSKIDDIHNKRFEEPSPISTVNEPKDFSHRHEEPSPLKSPRFDEETVVIHERLGSRLDEATTNEVEATTNEVVDAPLHENIPTHRSRFEEPSPVETMTADFEYPSTSRDMPNTNTNPPGTSSPRDNLHELPSRGNIRKHSVVTRNSHDSESSVETFSRKLVNEIQNSCVLKDEAALILQAAFRGFILRNKGYSKRLQKISKMDTGDKSIFDDTTVPFLQAGVKGYLTQHRELTSPPEM